MWGLCQRCGQDHVLGRTAQQLKQSPQGWRQKSLYHPALQQQVSPRPTAAGFVVHGDQRDCREIPGEAGSHLSSQGSRKLSAPAGSTIGLSGDRGGNVSRVMPTCVQSFTSGNLSCCHVPGTVQGAGDIRPRRASLREVKTLKGAGRGRLPSTHDDRARGQSVEGT